MRRFVLLTNVISPHQLPLAREMVLLVGKENFRYLYTDKSDEDHKSFKWCGDVPQWCVCVSEGNAWEWLENADVLISGLREFNLYERRATRGLKNFYMTERWFKPPIGIGRLLHSRYFGYARRLCKMMADGSLVGLPIGIHAASDMARLCGLMHGDLRCLFRVPKLEFERKPGGKIGVSSQGLVVSGQLLVASRRYCLDKMRMWGYFVESSKLKVEREKPTKDLRVLWVGRLLKLKRVDTIIKAVGALSLRQKIKLDIYGTGPEEMRLKRMSAKYADVVRFHPPVDIDEVRKLMHEHDVYVLASNGYEGWGAVVSEALEEGMRVIGTYEAGSSATMLPEENLFCCGDVKSLMGNLRGSALPIHIGSWCARNAAKTLCELAGLGFPHFSESKE